MGNRFIKFKAKFPLEYFPSHDLSNMHLLGSEENVPVIFVKNGEYRERVVGIAQEVTLRPNDGENLVEVEGLLFAEGGLEIYAEPIQNGDIRLACVTCNDFVTCSTCAYRGGELQPGVYSCRNYKLPFCREDDFCSYGKPR